LYLRLDFTEQAAGEPLEARFVIEPLKPGAPAASYRIALTHGLCSVLEASPQAAASGAAFVCQHILEARIPLESIGAASGDRLRVQLSLWRNGLPLDALPYQGWLEISTAEPAEWPV
ncbi:MAG: hypothetical protein ACPL88_06485, partial [Bryobacteraceae bacterium]